MPITNLATGDTIDETWVDSVANTLNGFTGAWTSFTPAVSGFTAFTYSSSGAYLQIGKHVAYRGQFTISTLTTKGTAVITVSLPVTSVAYPAGVLPTLGSLQATTGGSVFVGVPYYNSTTAFGLRIPSATTASNISTVTGAVPASLAAGDIFSWLIVYEAA